MNRSVGSLRRIIRVLSVHFSKRFWLFLAVFLLSLHQATILAYGEFGREAIAANIEQLSDAFIPNSLVISYIKQLGIERISFRITIYMIPLFFVQSIPVLIYTCFSSVKDRRVAALTIWILPALLGLPTLGITVVYLLSPLYTIFTFPGFMFLNETGQTHKEDFAEGLIFTVAAIGWFHVFWLAVTVKIWFFPRHLNETI
jgi:hypothetical protein